MIKYPENVIKIAKILKENGYEAYAVGGCVRDAIMGRTPNDWDMTTSCSPEKMLEIFENANIRTIPTGLKHGTLTVLLDGCAYECTTYRIDGEYTDSRRPDSVTFTKNLADDLCRRDFTVNAMAGDPLTDGEIVDLYGGRADIESKIIRAVGDPEKRFTEDALRILRAIRFATVLDFDIDPDTKNAATSLGHRLSDISAERKAVEFEKILLSSHPDRGMALLLECDIAKYIHPEIKTPRVAVSSLPERFPTRLAAVFGDIPSLSCMKLSNEITKQTKLLCDDRLYEDCLNFSDNVNACARFAISKYGNLARDAALLRNDENFALVIANESERSPAVSIKDLKICGNDLMAVGIKPQKIGGIMQNLTRLVIADPAFNTREKLISTAKNIENKETENVSLQ